MWFVLGYIAGLATSALIFAVAAYFRKPVERVLQKVEHEIRVRSPQQRGFIVEPPSEVEEARERVLERNRRQGKDTPIDELRSS
jgi:hypothetical protein